MEKYRKAISCLTPQPARKKLAMPDLADHVSVVLPIFNEVDHIGAALESLANGGYPKDKIEFVLVDGGSADGTLAFLEELKKDSANIRVLHNDQKTTPHALNIGIREASHSIVLRADAHAIYSQGYIQRSVELLISGIGDNIGGVVFARAGESNFSKLIALLLNSKFGNGGAKYRTNKVGSYVDTVWCGCWYKTTLEEVGLFDTDWTTNQDAELNARLISKGFKIYSDPKIRAELLVRSDFTSFLRQYFNYGRGRLKTFLRHSRLINIRQILPVIAVMGLFAGIYVLTMTTLAVLIGFTIVLGFILRPQANTVKLPFCYLALAGPMLVAMNWAWVTGVCFEGSKLIAKFLRRLSRNETHTSDSE